MATADLFCFSPQRFNSGLHTLLAPFARERRVFFVEAPTFHAAEDGLKELQVAANIWRVPPRLRSETTPAEQMTSIGRLLAELCERQSIVSPVHWHLTPTTLPLAAHLPRSLVVYDCIDELCASPERLAAQPHKRAALFAVDAAAHAFRQSIIDRMQRLMKGAEASESPSTRRLAKAGRPLPTGLSGAAHA